MNLPSTKWTSKEEWIKLENGQEMYTHRWEPKGKVVATVVFVHGVGEHCRRYDHIFGEYFAPAGILTESFDQRGFGKTSRKGGLIGHNETLETVMNDLAQAEKRVKRTGVPHFIMGHSMGGGIVLRYAVSRKTEANGIIVSGPLIALGSGSQVPYIQRLAVLGLASLLPTFTINNSVNADDLSRDPIRNQSYREDPDVHSYISLSTVRDIVLSGEVLSANGYQDFTLPLLILHGMKDVITSPEAAKEFVGRVKSKDKEFAGMEGWYHEVHNEPEYRVLAEKYVGWILKRSMKNE